MQNEYHAIEISNQLDPKKKIWRYMSIEKFALLMSRQQLWFARADLLGDEHEGSLPDCLIDARHQRIKDRRVLEKIERGSKESRKHAFMSCWSMQSPKMLSMWKIYTPNASGIAVKTTVGRLSACFLCEPNDDFFHTHNVRIEKVNYINFISYEATSDDFDRFTHKQKAYYYEKEIRTIISSKNPSTVDEPQIGIERKIDLDILIEDIFVSHLLGDGLELLVEELLLETGIEKDIIQPPFIKQPRF